MATTNAQTGTTGNESENAVSGRSPAEIEREREENRLYDGKAMEADSITIMNHNISGNGSGESGSQGNALGWEDQTHITSGLANPDSST